MTQGYFHRMTEQTPTRLWINNPSGTEMEQAIAAGAINCTTNPAYCSKLLETDPEYLHALIDEVIQETRDHDAAAARIYQLASQRVMERFLPLYENSAGRSGYVTVQDDPRVDEDANAIIHATLENRHLGRNYMAKIPVTAAGLQAIEVCVQENIPICTTEVFAIAQTISVCDLYEQAATKTGNRPPFYVTHITGIFDEYLGKVVKRKGISIAPKVLAQAGCAVGRKEYRLLKERGYSTTLLGGGARNSHHFTEFVGGDIHITINWSTAQELIDTDGPVAARIDAETSQDVVDELTAKLDDFRLAYHEDALPVDQYANYGPVQLFRNAFLKGWYVLLTEVVSRRHIHAL